MIFNAEIDKYIGRDIHLASERPSLIDLKYDEITNRLCINELSPLGRCYDVRKTPIVFTVVHPSGFSSLEFDGHIFLLDWSLQTNMGLIEELKKGQEEEDEDESF
jgi:hypothetical protein